MKNILTLVLLSFIFSCKNDKGMVDASGAFESVETIISSEANGVLKQFNIEEGMVLNAGDTIGYVDSTQVYLKKKQLEAQIRAVLSKRPDINPQLAALKAQLKAAEKDKMRYETLVNADAAPQKKLDDIITQTEVLKSQIEALQSTLGITSGSITEETIPLSVQIEQLNDQLLKCLLINPVKGTVLVKYAEVNEVAAAGKPLYKIADLSELILRAYITGDQLTSLKTGQQVKVLIDDEKGTKEYAGIVQWISDKAEFTPKTIQTRKERADKVYAVKIAVQNDGRLKSGMYAEVIFQ